MGAYDRAEPLYRLALEIRKKALGEEHPDYASQPEQPGRRVCDPRRSAHCRMHRAEPLYRQALEIRKKAVGEGHPDYATSLNNLAMLYARWAHDQAEPLYARPWRSGRRPWGRGTPTMPPA